MKPDQKDIKKSIIVPLLERIIKKFSLLSLYERIVQCKWKDRHHECIPFWFAEVYILCWFVSILVGLILFPILSRISNYLCLILVGMSIYRLSEILFGSGKIFFIEIEDRYDQNGYYVLARHAGRWVILTFINVIEIILCFSILFRFWGYGFEKEIMDSLTAFYQSILTITTLGYGEIHANSNASKILVIFQLFYFLIYFLLILPRVFSVIRAKATPKATLGRTDSPDE